MNTLSKEVTATFFKTADQYQRLRARWSELMNDSETCKTLRAEHHLLYLALLGKDWRRGFCYTRNPRKLENGYLPTFGAMIALSNVKSLYNSPRLLAPFAGVIDEDILKSVRARLPKSGWYTDLLAEDAYVEVPAVT